MERNLQDALNVVRNVLVNPRLVPGGGALEMALAQVVWSTLLKYTSAPLGTCVCLEAERTTLNGECRLVPPAVVLVFVNRTLFSVFTCFRL